MEVIQSIVREGGLPWPNNPPRRSKNCPCTFLGTCTHRSHRNFYNQLPRPPLYLSPAISEKRIRELTKSVRRRCPSASRRQFSGLRSRYTIPCLCNAVNARKTSAT